MVLAVIAGPALAAVDRVPGAEEALEAHERVSAWVRAWTAPPSPADDPFRVESAGASVTLRLGGRVLGRATSMVGDGGDVHRATLGAWREASGRLVVEQDEIELERIEVLASRVTVEVELAGPLTPVEGTTFDEAAGAASPGRTGVAMRLGQRTEAVFPGVQMGTGASPARALRAASGALGLPPVELMELRRTHQATPAVFETVHVVQVRPGGAPTFLHRGGRYVPSADVTGALLRASAAAMARHLRESAWPEGADPLGLRGNYRAISAQYDPPVASARTQALAAYALARFGTTPGMGAESSGDAIALAARVLAELAVVSPGEDDPLADPVASALVAVAAPMVVAVDPRMEVALAVAEFGTKARAAAREAAQSGAASQESAAVVAWALARVSRSADGAALTDRAIAEGMVREVMRSGGVDGLLSASPWVVWAALELQPEGELSGEVALRDLRSATWARQIGDAVAGTGDQDYEGGIVLTAEPTPPNAAHTLRALSALPAMLGDARLTPEDEVLAEVARVRRSLRFVLQLMFRDEEAYLARDRDRAIGGVRPALWEPVASTDATAMGLIVISDTLRAVRSRSER